MPEEKNCKLLQVSRSSDKKKKRKKKRKKAATPPENSEKPQAVSLPAETLPVSLQAPQSPAQPRVQPPKPRAPSKKDRERLAGSGRRSKKHPKDSPALLTASNKPGGSGVAELSAQARESLRWEGALEDPQAEEQRLELYRANRRQRYIAHREALFKDTQTFSKESKEEKALTESERQKAASLLRLSTD